MTEVSVSGGFGEEVHFGPVDGPTVKEHGRAVRKASVTYIDQIHQPFKVETNEGTMQGQPGDYLAYDEKSGHVWPVAKDYVDLDYEPAQDAPQDHSAVYMALHALESAAGHLSAVDVSNAVANLAEVRYRPLTQLTIQAATTMRQHIEQDIGLVTEDNVGLVPEEKSEPAADPVKCPSCAEGYLDGNTSACPHCGYTAVV